MENNEGRKVDIYYPRKCSATNRVLNSSDHASVQINIAEVDSNGRATGDFKTYAFSGFLRSNGEVDDSLNRLATQDGYLKSTWTYQGK